MKILGVSCDYHDAAAAVVVDGEIVAASEEERFSRSKHDASLPEGAIVSCLAIAGLDPGDLDAIVFHEKPLVVASRVLAARQRRGPAALGAFARDFPVLLRRNALVGHRIEQLIRRMGATPPPIAYCEHHLSHAAAAFYPSPFETAAILTVDGIGEWTTATMAQGMHHRIDLLAEQRYPHSLGLLYSLATRWCGFEPNDGEYKLMGLAPFGEPSMTDALEQIVRVGEDGSIEVDARRVGWWGGDPTSRRRLISLLGPARRPDEPLDRRHADLARSVQELTETAVMRMAEHARVTTGERNLCLAGGVALNCVATGRVLRESGYDDVWVQPASGDSGSAIGAALWYEHGHTGTHRRVGERDSMSGAALGPAFGSDEIGARLAEQGVRSRRVPDVAERCREVAARLADGAVVGWFEGRMEFGPRALGHRSILADPRSPTMQHDLNLRVKGRESFRPFAPAVLWEHAPEWFDLDLPMPYMSFVVDVAGPHRIDVPPADEPEDLFERARIARSDIPACTHVDGTARVQTVHDDLHPAFHRLLTEFHALTGCPVLLNTSFNRAGEPIVCTPDDALATADAAGLDLLVLQDHLIEVETAGRP